MKVRLLDLAPQYESIREEIDEAVSEVIASQYFIMGPKVASLEEAVADLCGVKHGVGVASGSDAILLALMALGVGPGDEVITTPYTFFSTVSSITRTGATPVMVDIDPDTYNISPGKVAGAVSGRTKAVLAVHLFGQMADMEALSDIAGDAGVAVVEDACQSIGATRSGVRAGAWGTAGCFSFFPSKNLGGFGDGGMVVTDDDRLAARVRLLRNHGGRERYYHDEIGINSRLDALQAAVLLVKMRHLERWSERRRENAAYYDERLGSVEQVETPLVEEGNVSIYNQYVIRARDRDGLKAWLGSEGIGCEIYYPVPLHLQKCFSYLGGSEGDLPEAERAARETLALPVYPELPREHQDHVIEKIEEYYRR